MIAAEIINQARIQPFKPFRLYVSDGSQYEIRHRDAIFVSHSIVVVGLHANENDSIPDRTVYIDPMHVVKLEYIEPIRVG